MKKIILFFLLAAPLGAQTPAPAASPSADSPQALFDKAKGLFDAKHYQEARDSLGQLVAKYPTENFVPQARLLLANLEEDFSSATARFQMLAAEYEGSPEGAEAQKDLADRYYLADKYGEAARAYQDYVDQYPKSPQLPEVRYWLGSSFVALEQDDSAVEQFRKILDEAKDSPWAPKSRLALGAVYFKQGRYDQAEPQYLKILQDDPAYDELDQVYFKLGQTFEREKKDRQAYASYQTLLDRYPNALEAKDAQDRLAALAKVHPDYVSASAPENPTASPTPGSTPPPQAAAPTPALTMAPEPTAAPTAAPTEVPEALAPPQARPFHVQVGVFTQQAYVAKAEKSLSKLGYQSFVVSAKPDSSPYRYYKVRSGQYATRAEAEKDAKKLSRLLKQQVIVVEDQNN